MGFNDLYNNLVEMKGKYMFNDALWIGYDDFFKTLEKSKDQDKYPPHNVFSIDDNNFGVELALAGFKPEDLKVEFKKNLLTIAGDRKDSNEKVYTYRGLATRKFSKSFYLGNYVGVTKSTYENGILTVLLERRLPEEEIMKPVMIETSPQPTLLKG